MLLAAIAALTLTGCSSLKSLVKSAENDLNNILDGTHGVVTNAANAAISPLK